MKKIVLLLFASLFSVYNYAQCVQPWVFDASNIGMNSASLTWIELGTATAWQVVVQAPDSGYPDGTDVYTPTMTFGWPIPSEDLAPATTYEYWIRSDCGDGSYSVWAGPYYFTTAVCNAEDQCTYTVTMWEENSTGWDSTMFINQNGYQAAVLLGPLTEPGPVTQEVQLCNGVPFELAWPDINQFGETIGVSITNALGQVVYTKHPWTESPGILYTGMVDCDTPECLPPAGLETLNPTLSTIDLSWAGPAEGEWEYFIAAAGSSAPQNTDTGTLTTANPAVGVSGLESGTEYEYYVRMLCEDGITTEWAGPYLFRTSLCDPAAQCNFTFNLYSDFAPGWQDGYMTVSQNGSTVAEIGKDFTWGSSKEITVALCTGEPFEILWTSAGNGYEGEMALEVIDPFGQVIYELPYSSNGLGTIIYEGIVSCDLPTCVSPNGLTVSNATTTMVDLAWNGPETGEWEYYIIEAGQPAPTEDATGVLTESNPTLGVGPLEQGTVYEYYVRVLCDGAGTSTSVWAGPYAFNLAPCDPEDKCTYTFEFTDVEGQGLGGNYMVVSQGGITLATIGAVPFGSGELSTELELCPDVPVTITAYKGWYTQDIGFAVYTPYGEVLFTMQEEVLYNIEQGGTPVVIYSGLPTCDPTTCPKPANLTVANISMDSVEIGWTEEGGATQWEVFVVEQGEQGPIADTTGSIVNSNPVTITDGIEPGKKYQYYVRAVCGEDDKSLWTGPYHFTSSLCALEDQCAYTFTMSSSNESSDGWFGDTMEVTQGGVVVAVLSGPRFADGNVDVEQTIYLCTGIPFSVRWINFYGDPPQQHIGLSITHDFTGETVFEMAPGEGAGLGSSILYSAMVYCSEITCPQPTEMISSGIDATSIALDWEPGGTEGQWEVIIQEAGGPMPQLADLDISAMVNESNYTVSGLIENVLYEYYVRAVCGENNSFWSGPFQFSVVFNDNGCSVEVADENNPDLGTFINGDEYIICPGDDVCIDFTASYTETGLTTDYIVETINYTPYSFTGGTQVDFNAATNYTGILNLPFDFCFYGQTYNEFLINPFGMVSFDTSKAGASALWPNITIPNSAFTDLNGIYGVFQALSPAEYEFAEGDVNYQIIGSYPCRKLVVNFNDMASMGCPNNPVVGAQTSQIVLHEATNVIEVYVERRVPCLAWGQLGVIGIQNGSGTDAVVPEGYNAGPWDAHEVAFRFTPSGPSNVVFEWLELAQGQTEPVLLGNENTIEYCADEPSQLIARATYTICDGEEYIKESAITVRVADPIIAEEPADITACSNGEEAEVNLNPAIEGIVTEPELYNFTFYATEAEAMDGGNDTALPAEYTAVPGTYTLWIRIERNNEPCFVLRSFVLTINEVVSVDILENVTACDTFTLPELTNGSYFSGEGGTGIQLFEGDVITSSQTIYIYNESGTEPNCTSESSFEVSIMSTPEFDLGGPYTACAPSNVTVTVNPVNFIAEDAEYLWTVNDIPVENNTSSIVPAEFGSYSVTVALGGCSSTQTAMVMMDATEIDVEVTDYCEDNVYMIEAVIPAESDIVSYEWEGPNGFTSSTKATVVDRTGAYIVVVTTVDGCTGTATFDVTDTACSIQRGISPDGDGLNDFFALETMDVRQLSIFNRYGQEVYNRENYKNEWHGQSNNGDELPTGTYYYVIHRENGEQRTGWIYLNRQE